MHKLSITIGKNKLRALSIVLVLLLPFLLVAQEENWDVYMAQYDDKPGSTVLNMSLKTKAPFRDLPFVCITGVKFSDCTSDGLPTPTAFPELYKIGDTIKSNINRLVKNMLVGSFTHQCERLDYFYVADTTGLRQMLLDIYAKQFPSFIPYFNIKDDANWQAYFKFLYPGEEAFEFMQNQKVVMQVYNAGDNLTKERQVDHWLYFKTENDRDDFITYARSQHYKIESKERIEGSLNKFKLQISRVDNIQLANISKITLELRRQAVKRNGDYDGWETFVVKD